MTFTEYKENLLADGWEWELSTGNYNSDYLTHIQSSIIDHGRWTITYRHIYHYIPNNEFYEVIADEPATEIQDGMEIEFRINQVFPKEKTIIVYE